MEKSQTIKEIATALCNFHKEVSKVKKSETNPFFKSKYADLSSILDVIREPLINNNLSFVQFPTGENQLTTLLMHSSGEWIQGEYKMTPTKNDPQGLGSVITYQRRYALGAILGLNIDEDDDGNKASTPHNEQSKSDEKPWLNPKTEVWTKAVAALNSGQYLIIDIEKKYRLSKENKALLINESL
jgi:hypothetical protein